MNENNDQQKGVFNIRRLKEMMQGKYIAYFGLVVAIAVPLWQVYFVERAQLSVEIGAIRKIYAADLKIELEASGLTALSDFIPDNIKYRYYPDGEKEEKISPKLTVEELKELLKRAKLVEEGLPQKLWHLKDTIADIEKLHGLHDFIRPDDKSKHKIERLKHFSVRQYRHWQLPHYLDPFLVDFYGRQLLKYTVARATPTAEEVDSVMVTLRHLLTDLGTARIKLEENEKTPLDLHEVEEHVEEVFAQLLYTHATFKVTVSVSNSGKISTSIKHHALLRVYIGVDDYVDLFLSMDDFKNNAEIGPNATKVISFSSQALSTYPENDHKLINQYWGQSVLSILYVMDSRDTIYASRNSIAFSEGLNQKIIYDRLEKEASKQQYYQYKSNQ